MARDASDATPAPSRLSTRLTAIVRGVSPAIARCELTHFDRMPIDLDLARRQHSAYVAALVSLGVGVVALGVEPDLPDSVFVEDTAIVLDEVAIITRPGAASRLAETNAVSAALATFRTLLSIETPGTIDGGDVLVVGKRVFVGQSNRTNRHGIEQLRQFVSPFGYSVHPIVVSGCLHLKSAVTQVASNTLLINPAYIPPAAFSGLEFIEVAADEPHAANALLVGDAIVFQPSSPKTLDRVAARGFEPARLVDLSELAKAEAALTCCSLLFKTYQ